jgi:hypothetical protein
MDETEPSRRQAERASTHYNAVQYAAQRLGEQHAPLTHRYLGLTEERSVGLRIGKDGDGASAVFTCKSSYAVAHENALPSRRVEPFVLTPSLSRRDLTSDTTSLPSVPYDSVSGPNACIHSSCIPLLTFCSCAPRSPGLLVCLYLVSTPFS